jgi:hypothetical protein
MLRQSLAQAVWAGLPVGLGAMTLLWTQHRGMLSQRLLLGLILATLGISFVTWWRLRHYRSSHD